MKDSIDEKDKKILEILQENSSLSSHKISKKTLIPVTTVNNRIKKLRKSGVIRKFTIDVDKSKLGFGLVAYVFLTVSLEELKQENMKIKDLMKIIRNNTMVESVDNVTGDVDVVIKMLVRDINDLNDYVANTLSYYKGVEKTKTALVLRHN